MTTLHTTIVAVLFVAFVVMAIACGTKQEGGHAMSREEFLAAKSNLIRSLRKIIADAEQLRADITWWNENRLEHTPLDAGGDIITSALARDMLALVEAEKPIPASMYKRLAKHMEANAKR